MSCGKKTNLPYSSANGYDDPQIWAQKINFPICTSANSLSENILSVLSNSPKGRVLSSELLIHLFHFGKQDIHSSNVTKYKHKI